MVVFGNHNTTASFFLEGDRTGFLSLVGKGMGCVTNFEFDNKLLIINIGVLYETY